MPEIYFCDSKGPDSLRLWEESAIYAGGGNDGRKGFVVKLKSGQGSQGVYLLESGFGGREMLSGKINMTRTEVISSLQKVIKKWGNNWGNNFHVEELLTGPVSGVAPNDYKFHVANGEIVYAAVMANRGTDRACTAIVDEHFERCDHHGCFGNDRPESYVPPSSPGECAVANSSTSFDGSKRCSDFSKPLEWDLITATAKKMSRIIGIYVRIDMYVHRGEVVLGEATFLPALGKHHCFSTLDQNGCIDPCGLGRFLKQQNELFNNEEGGPIPPEPDVMKGWRHLSDKEKCERVMEVNRRMKAE